MAWAGTADGGQPIQAAQLKAFAKWQKGSTKEVEEGGPVHSNQTTVDFGPTHAPSPCLYPSPIDNLANPIGYCGFPHQTFPLPFASEGWGAGQLHSQGGGTRLRTPIAMRRRYTAIPATPFRSAVSRAIF